MQLNDGKFSGGLGRVIFGLVAPCRVHGFFKMPAGLHLVLRVFWVRVSAASVWLRPLGLALTTKHGIASRNVCMCVADRCVFEI